MIITTTDGIDGLFIAEYCGLVSGIDDYLVGGIIGEGLFAKEMTRNFSSSVERIKEQISFQAEAMGANAIVGLKQNVFSLPATGGRIYVQITGTACKAFTPDELELYREETKAKREEEERIRKEELERKLREEKEKEEAARLAAEAEKLAAEREARAKEEKLIKEREHYEELKASGNLNGRQICSNCGRVIVWNPRGCNFCGAKIDKEEN